MKKHKLLSLTLSVLIMVGLVTSSIYPLYSAFADNLDEVNEKSNIQGGSLEEKSPYGLQQENELEVKPETKMDVQSTPQGQTRGAEESQVEGSLAVNSTIVSASNKPENKAEEGWTPTGAIADINIKLQASNKGNATDDAVIKGLHADITIPRKYLEEDYFSKKGYQILGGNNLKIVDSADKDNIYLKVSCDELEVGSILAFQVRVKVKLPHYVNDKLVNPKIKHGSTIDVRGILYDENNQKISDEVYGLKIHAKSNYIARSNNYTYSRYLKEDDAQLKADKKNLVEDENILKDLTYYINVRDTYFWQARSHTDTGVYLPDKVKVKLTPKTLAQGEVKITDSSWTKDGDGSYYKYVVPTIKNQSTTEYVDANTSVKIKLPGYEVAKSHDVFDVSVVLVDESDKEIPETQSKTETYSAGYYIEKERPPHPDNKLDLRSKITLKNSGDYYYNNNKEKETNWSLEIKNDNNYSKKTELNLYLGNIDNFQMEKNFYITKLSFDTSKLSELDGDITYKLTAIDVDSGKTVDLGTKTLQEEVTFEPEKYVRPKVVFSKAITIPQGEYLKMNLTTKVFSQDYDNYDNYKNWKQANKVDEYDIQYGKTKLTDRKLNIGIAGYFYTNTSKEERVDRYVKYSSNFKTSDMSELVIQALLGRVDMDQHPSYSHKLKDSNEFVDKNRKVVANTGDTVRMNIDVGTNLYVKDKEELKNNLRALGQRQYLKNPKLLIEVPGFEDTLDVSIKVKSKYGADREYKNVNISKENRGGKVFYVVPLDDENLAEFIDDFRIQYDVTFKDEKRPTGLYFLDYHLVYDNYGNNAFVNYASFDGHLEHEDRDDLNQNGNTKEKFLWGKYNVEYGSAFKVFGSTASLEQETKNGKVEEDDYYNLKHNISNVYPVGAKHNLGLGVENRLDGPIKSMRIVDVLAHKNDKMQISGQERNSGTRLMLTGPVTVDTASKQFTSNKDAKFEITYSTAEPGNLEANLQANFVGESEITDWSEVKMFQIKLVSGQIDPKKLAIFKVPVVSDSEENVTAAKDGYIYAANGFAYGASVSSKDTLSDPKSYVETVTNYPRYEIVRTVKFEKGDAGAINIEDQNPRWPFSGLIEKKVKNNEIWKKNIKDIVPNKFFKIADIENNKILDAANNYKWVAKDKKTIEWLNGKDISELDSEAINSDLTFEAKEIIKKEDPKDDRYVMVTFKSTDKGNFEQDKTEISYWVLKGTKFQDALNIEEYKTKNEKVKALEVPNVTAVVGEYEGWKIKDQNYSKNLADYKETINDAIEIIARYKIVTTRIDYQFVSGTTGKVLPDAVNNQLNNEKFVKQGNVGATVTAPQIAFTPVEDNNGIWKFDSWKQANIKLSSKAEDNKFIGIWKWHEYTGDKIIPFIPDENDPNKEPEKGSDGKDIPKTYITVTFKSEDVAKGKVKVGDKEGAVVKAKVAPKTDLSKSDNISTIPADNYGFTKWTPDLGEVEDNKSKEYTAYFIKSGDEIKEGDPIPKDWLKVTVTQDEKSIKENTVKEKTYALKPNDKLAKKNFVELTDKAKDGYENPAWYKDENKNSTEKPWEVAITKDTKFIAKADKKDYTEDKIVPYLPNEDDPNKEPEKGSDGKDIPKNYITVTFKSEDAAKGKVKVGNKEGAVVKAKVKPDTDLAKLSDIKALPADNYGFKKWDPELGVAKDGNTYTAYFIKNAPEPESKPDVIRVNEDINSPIPDGYTRVYFDPTKDGYLKYNPTFKRGEVIAFDIKSTLTWGDAKKAVKGLIVPTATHIDKNYRFKNWTPDIQSDNDVVKTQTYTAVYEKIEVNETKKPKTSPETGDNAMAYEYATLLLVAALGMLALSRLKKNKH